jgi:pimeloyl-ACP methyl ester carboxylesterase
MVIATLHRVRTLLFAILGFALLTATTQAGAQETSIRGSLPDGTAYGFIVPPNWNGVLIINPDFMFSAASIPTPTGENRWLLDHGYALGGTSRQPTLDYVELSVAALMGGLDLFEASFGVPTKTIVVGGSLGGFTARAAIESHPQRLHGALAMCGGGAGVIAGWNQKLDTAFVAKTLLAPQAEYPRLVNIGNASASTSAWLALIADARTTPAGRARLALAAAVGQMATFAEPSLPKPSDKDYELQLEHILATFELFVRPAIRTTIEGRAGGNISWNHDVDYRDLLNRSGLRKLVDYFYSKAGLDVRHDLDVLAAAPRISADPAAVAWAERNVSYTGNTGGRPVLSIHTAGDRSESPAFDEAYAETFRTAGSNSLLRQAWVDRAGHCSFTAAERLAAILALLERVNTGHWANIATEKSLNARAAQLAASSSIALGGSAYFTPKPAHFLRPWDGRHFGTYTPQ